MRKVTGDVSLAAKKDAESSLESAIGADRRMNGWRRVKLGVGYDLTSDTSSELKSRPNGPWKVLEYGRTPGAAAPKRGSGNRVLRTPWGPRTYSRAKPLRIGGSPAKHTWSNAVTNIEQETPKRALDLIVEMLKKVWF